MSIIKTSEPVPAKRKLLPDVPTDEKPNPASTAEKPAEPTRPRILQPITDDSHRADVGSAVPSDAKPSTKVHRRLPDGRIVGPTSPAPVPAPGKPASSAPGKPTIPHSKDVEKMQKEMIFLRKSFYDFIAEQGNFPGLKMIDRHLNSKNSSFSDKLKSIKDIGKIKNIKGTEIYEPDGFWGQKTSTALYNISDVSNMMLSISSKFNKNLNFIQKDIDLLKNQINILDKSREDLKTINSCANIVTAILEKIANSITSFADILKLVESSEDDKIPTEYNPKAKSQTNKTNLFAGVTLTNIPQNINDPKSQLISIKVSDLTNSEDFDNVILKNQISVDGELANKKETIIKFLDHLYEGINSGKIEIKSIDTGFGD